MKKFLLGVGVILLLVGVGFTLNARSSSISLETQFSYQDNSSGILQPVIDAEVQCHVGPSSTSPVISSARTDFNGKATLSNVPSNSVVTITCSQEGLSNFSQTIRTGSSSSSFQGIMSQSE